MFNIPNDCYTIGHVTLTTYGLQLQSYGPKHALQSGSSTPFHACFRSNSKTIRPVIYRPVVHNQLWLYKMWVFQEVVCMVMRIVFSHCLVFMGFDIKKETKIGGVSKVLLNRDAEAVKVQKQSRDEFKKECDALLWNDEE